KILFILIADNAYKLGDAIYMKTIHTCIVPSLRYTYNSEIDIDAEDQEIFDSRYMLIKSDNFNKLRNRNNTTKRMFLPLSAN
ncbi:MAG: hypothetical protein MJH11_05055, partial [Lentisphaeria bacterium]|nr:hypothetical protein [Lentisphaeria bacterium]